MDKIIINRTLAMLVRGGRVARQAMLPEMTGKGFDPWQAFPKPYQDMAQAIMQAPIADNGAVAMYAIENKIAKDSQKLLADIMRDVYENRAALEHKDYADHARAHVESFKRWAMPLKVNELNAKLSAGEFSPMEYAAATRDMLQMLETVGSYQVGMKSAELAPQAADRATSMLTSETPITISTGFDVLDKISALVCGEVCGIIGDAKQGKTQLAIQIAGNVAHHLMTNHKPGCVVFFSQEMTATMLLWRLAAAATRFKMTPLFSKQIAPDDPGLLSWIKTIRSYENLPLVIDQRSGLSAAAMQPILDKYSQEYGGVVLVVDDYAALGRADEKTFSEHGQVSKIYKEFKRLIKNHVNPDGSNPVGLMISDLNRNSDDAIPDRQRIKYAGDYDLSSAIAPINPQDYPNDKDLKDYLSEHPVKFWREDERLLAVAFNRYGQAGIIRGMRFIAECTRWEVGQW